VSYIVFGAIVLLDWLFIGGGLKGFLKSFFPAGGVAVAVYFILTMVGQNAAGRKVDQAEAKTEKLKYVPESTEWLNSLVSTLWATLQQGFFDNIASQINDTIKPYIPEGVPATVKVTELGHGTQPVRVLSMRSLPDSEFGDLVPTHGIDRSGSAEQTKEKEKAIEREEGGVFYNLEIAIAYHEAPFKSRKEHMHVDILAMFGPVPLPIFVQVKEFVATIRVRLQMHPGAYSYSIHASGTNVNTRSAISEKHYIRPYRKPKGQCLRFHGCTMGPGPSQPSDHRLRSSFAD